VSCLTRDRRSAELRENTTWDLGEHLLGRRSIIQLSAAVSDIEKLREKLGIDKWMVFGGSW
jgi:proline iminopeptidase